MNSRLTCPARIRQALQQCDQLEMWAQQHSSGNGYLAGQIKSNCNYLRQSISNVQYDVMFDIPEQRQRTERALSNAKFYFHRLLGVMWACK